MKKIITTAAAMTIVIAITIMVTITVTKNYMINNAMPDTACTIEWDGDFYSYN